MNKRYFLVTGLIILCLTLSAIVKAQANVDEKEGARIFVQKFYDYYTKLCISDLQKNKSPIDSAVLYTVKHKSRYFADSLLTNLKEYGSVFLFDPFLASFEFKSNYQAGSVILEGNNNNIFKVDVHCDSSRSKDAISNSPIAVIAEVTNVNNKWKFVNFIYPSPKHSNFLKKVVDYKIGLEEFKKNPKASE